MNKSHNYYTEEFKSNAGNKTQAKFYKLVCYIMWYRLNLHIKCAKNFRMKK